MSVEITGGGPVGGGRRERERDRGQRHAGPIALVNDVPPKPPPPERPPAVVGVPLEAGGDATISLTALVSLALRGGMDEVADLLCSMVVDATSGRRSPPVDVVLVGFGEEMHGLDGITAVHDERAALDVLEPGGTGGPGAPRRGRGATAVFVGARRDPEALRELVGRAGASVAVVVGGDCPDTRWRLDLHRQCLEEALVRQLGRPSALAEVAAAPEPQVEATIKVSVLGPVRVDGTPAPFDRRPKLTELVVYLAMHPEGATSDAWATALWPDRRMPMSTLSNRLSETRLALGVGRDGYAHLRKRGGRHHLGPDVSTDWHRFVALAGADDPAGWRTALELVRGRPFEGLRESQWTLMEGVVPAIESAVVELACRLAEHLLALPDPEAAEWAARRAMLACPWDERLYRLVMRAADAAGNRAGVEAALRQLACVLELGDEPLSAVHPETASLYRSLTHRRVVL